MGEPRRPRIIHTGIRIRTAPTSSGLCAVLLRSSLGSFTDAALFIQNKEVGRRENKHNFLPIEVPQKQVVNYVCPGPVQVLSGLCLGRVRAVTRTGTGPA